jgi:hypothetical protein
LNRFATTRGTRIAQIDRVHRRRAGHRRMDDHRTRALAAEVLRYVAQHPDAADTAEGIWRWWLPQGSAEYRESDVRAALEWLAERGALVRSRLPDGRELFAAAGSVLPC